MKSTKLNVGIIIGGRSVEHDISILSGLQVYHAIDKDKYNVTIFYINHDQEWLVGNELNDINTYISGNFSKCNTVTLFGENNNVYYKGVFSRPKATPIDVFIPVVHGEGVEDGTISGFLETLGGVHTNASVSASAILQDKIYTKELLSLTDIKILPFVKMSIDDDFTLKCNEIETRLDYPVIVKPSCLGSSIGIMCADNKDELRKGIEEAFKYDEQIIVEKKLTNYKEYNLAILKDINRIIPSLVEEVKPTNDILSFKDKYENLDKMSDVSNRIIPAILPPELEKLIKTVGIKAYQLFRLSGVVRIDFLFDEQSNLLYLNEINTIPGSLAFYLFDKLDISFTQLIDILIKNAIVTKNQQMRYIKSFKSSVLSQKGTKLTK